MSRRLTAIGVANTLARGLRVTHDTSALVKALEDLSSEMMDMASSLEEECAGHPELERRCWRDAQFLGEVADRLEELTEEEKERQTKDGYDKLTDGWIG